MLMAVIHRSFWLTLLLITTSCAELKPVASPVVASPTVTVVASPTMPLTVNPTPTLSPSPTLPPTPIPESSWQCYPSGGLACFDDLISVTMVNADEGWATTLRHHRVLHYTTRPGDSVPTWQLVERSKVVPFRSLVMISPDEGWAIGRSNEAAFVHYKDGQWQGIPGRCCANDLAMVSPDEGWAVGFDGLIATGTYHVWIRGYAPNAAGDSIHVGLTSMELTPTIELVKGVTGLRPRQWHWNNQTLGGAIATLQVDEPGLYTLHLWAREDGVKIDRLLLTLDSGYQPVGFGPS